MSYRLAKAILNRPGGRAILGHLLTAKARLSGNQMRVFYDGCWIHQSGQDSFAEWEPATGRNPSHWLRVERKYWFPFYTPKPGDTIIEIGAGVGIETILFSRAIGAKGRIVSVEAHPRTYACLLKTCEHNSLRNVIPLNVALVEKESTVHLEDSTQHIGNAVTPDGTGSISVRGRSLDDICTELGIASAAFLRMNIEGAEQFAIRGMEKTIANTAYAAIACHDFKADRTGNDFFRTRVVVTQFLQDHGFQIVPMQFEEPWAKDHVYAFNTRIATSPVSPQ